MASVHMTTRGAHLADQYARNYSYPLIDSESPEIFLIENLREIFRNLTRKQYQESVKIVEAHLKKYDVS